MSQKKSDIILKQRKPWENNENSVWLASIMSFSRNIEKFKFPMKLEVDRKKQLISIVTGHLSTNPSLKNPQILRAEDIVPLDKEYLSEHFFTNVNFHQAHIGEAFVLDEKGEFLATVNIGNHIQLYLLDVKNELESTWNRLMAIESSLGKTVSYAYSNKYGFLTADYNCCGTAFNTTVFLQVPALVHTGKLEEWLEKFSDESLLITGIQGNPKEIIGDTLMVQNNYTLGVSEENIITSLRSFSTKISIEENSVRNKIKQEESAEIKDKVSRAFGILMHSYQIEAVEALNALSLLKLGLELGWLTGIQVKDVNKLFLSCRRAHLLNHYKQKKLKSEDIPHKRAEFIHERLQEVKSTIG